MKKILLIIVILVFSITALAGAQWKEGPIVNYGRYEASGVSVIVTFKAEAKLETILMMDMSLEYELAQLTSISGVSLPAGDFTNLKGFFGRDFSHGVITFPPEKGVGNVINELSDIKEIRTVEPNYLLKSNYVSNDPYLQSNQKNFFQIYVDKAWNISQGEGVIVAVIDTGYRQNGLEDRAKNLLQGYDFRENDSDVQDYVGHGTHISNTIAERTNNGIGCAGIAFKSTILPCKVFPDVGEGAYESDIIDAIYWAVDQGAHVINMSLGGGGYVSASDEAINFAVENDVTVFAATGNDGVYGISYPARHEGCIAVGATNSHLVGGNPTRADFSQYGVGLDLVAPGSNIVQETWSHYSGVGYFGYYGTSSASPHAAGVAALLVARSGPDALLIREAMESTAYNPDGGWTDELGWGEINAYDALYAYGGPLNDGPIAVATAYPSLGAPPLTVTFDASESYDPDGEIVYYRWTKEGGIILSSLAVFTETFDDIEKFNVTLTIRDNEDSIGVDTVEIEVDQSYTNDDCYQMLDIAYDGCKLMIFDADGIGIEDSTALESCRADSDGDFWECLLECSDHEDVNSCSSFVKCADQRCDINVRATYKSKSDDDGTDLCSLCG